MPPVAEWAKSEDRAHPHPLADRPQGAVRKVAWPLALVVWPGLASRLGLRCRRSPRRLSPRDKCALRAGAATRTGPQPLRPARTAAARPPIGRQLRFISIERGRDVDSRERADRHFYVILSAAKNPLFKRLHHPRRRHGGDGLVTCQFEGGEGSGRQRHKGTASDLMACPRGSAGRSIREGLRKRILRCAQNDIGLT